MKGIHFLSDDFLQDIFIESNVVEYLIKNQQRHTWNAEAGGQLFGEVSTHSITITHATGPYPKDDRGPRHYRSHPQSAQRELSRQNRLGNTYLGEWHTHAEKIPKISQDDVNAMQRILTHSDLAINGLLLVIVGQHSPEKSISAYSYMNNALVKWNVIVN